MDEAKKSEWTCPDCGTAVDVSKMGFLADVTCPKCGREGHANTTLANFRLVNILGIGGMSVVMRAYDPTLGRPLAIKLLNETYRTQEDRIRKFEGECSLMAKVRHENVVSVYSAGWDKGQFYIAMELVDGENLELIIDRRKFLLPIQAVEIIRQVALGLQAAHKAGLLHRDVKPGNVIITKGNQAKVLDFGLSMESQQEDGDKEEIIWATPFYVPPETLRREREDVRSDIYALGMTLRNLLTGEDTLKGEFHSVSSLLALKEKYPSMRATYPHLDPDLCDFVDRMSAFKPGDRPADYSDVLAELAEVQEHLAKVGQRRAKRLWLAEKKREIMILGGAAVLGIILATTVVCSSTVQMVQRYLSVPTEPASQEWQNITKAETLVISSRWEDAGDMYAKVAQKAQDPAVGMRAGMLAAMFKLLQQQPREEVAKWLQSAAGSLAAAKEDPLMAQGDWQELEQALMLAQTDAPPDAGKVAKLRQPLLRVAVDVLAAARAMDEGLADEAQALVAAASAEAVQAGGSLGEMASLLNRFKLELSRSAVPKLRERVLRQLGGGMLEQAQQGMQSLGKLQLSPAEEAELQVQQELCKVALAAFETFRRHGQDPVKAFSGPQEFHDAARRVKKSRAFAKEMQCLAYMMRGEYSVAFSLDPYKDSADSQTPFAVLMRHWRQLLGVPAPAGARSLPGERREPAKAADNGKAAQKVKTVVRHNPSGAESHQVNPEERATFEKDLKEAEKGDVEAMKLVSHHYRTGQGVEENMQEALRWNRKAADQGDPQAMFDVGWSYYSGESGSMDLQETAKWWRKAADRGSRIAQFLLGTLYREGRGVPKDEQEAIKWFRKAAAQGEKSAQEALKELGVE